MSKRPTRRAEFAGRPVALVAYDDGSDAAKANGFAKRLIDDDRVDVILGGSTTGGTMAMVPLVEKAEIPLISFAGGVVIVEPVRKWVFKVPHNDRMAAERVFQDMKKRGLTKIALLSETSGFGQSGRKESLAAAAKAGIVVAADETYGPKDTDVTAQLTKIRGVDGVQAIFVFGLGEGPAIVMKDIAQLGIKLPIYQSHGVASQQFIRLAGAAAEGVRLPAAAILVPDQLPDSDPQKAVENAYVALYKSKTGEDVSTFGGHAADAFTIWKAAVQRAGSTDKAKVRDEIEKTSGFTGTGWRRHHVAPGSSRPEDRGLSHDRDPRRQVEAGGLTGHRGSGLRLAPLPTDGRRTPCRNCLQYLITGLTVGATYALAALGFSIVYNASHVINFAQGEFIMLGGMIAAALASAGVPLALAVIGAIAATALIGYVVARLAIEPARGTPTSRP